VVGASSGDSWKENHDRNLLKNAELAESVRSGLGGGSAGGFADTARAHPPGGAEPSPAPVKAAPAKAAPVKAETAKPAPRRQATERAKPKPARAAPKKAAPEPSFGDTEVDFGI
jgi:hypothetical protein